MTTPTFILTIRTTRLLGSVKAGLLVSLQLNEIDTDTISGESIPANEVSAVTDGAGLATALLWPNDAGTQGSRYAVTIRSADGKQILLRTHFLMPSQDAYLDVILGISRGSSALSPEAVLPELALKMHGNFDVVAGGGLPVTIENNSAYRLVNIPVIGAPVVDEIPVEEGSIVYFRDGEWHFLGGGSGSNLSATNWDMTPDSVAATPNAALPPEFVGVYAPSTIVGKEVSISASAIGTYLTMANFGVALPRTGKYWFVWKPHALVGTPAVAVNTVALVGDRNNFMAPGGVQLIMGSAGSGLSLNSAPFDVAFLDEDTALVNIDFDAGTVLVRTPNTSTTCAITGGFVAPGIVTACIASLGSPGATVVSARISSDPADLAGLTPELGYLPLASLITNVPTGLTAPALLNVTVGGTYAAVPYAVGDGAILVDSILNTVIPLGATRAELTALDARVVKVEKLSHATSVIKLTAPIGNVYVSPVSSDNLIDCAGAGSSVRLWLYYAPGAAVGDRLTFRFTNIAENEFVNLDFGIVGWQKNANFWNVPQHVMAGDYISFVWEEYSAGAFAWVPAGAGTAANRIDNLAVTVGLVGNYTSLTGLVADLSEVKCEKLSITLLGAYALYGGEVDFTSFKRVEITASHTASSGAELKLIGHEIKLSGTFKYGKFETVTSIATILDNGCSIFTNSGVSPGVVIDRPVVATGASADVSCLYYDVEFNNPSVAGTLHVNSDGFGGNFARVKGHGDIEHLQVHNGSVHLHGDFYINEIVNNDSYVGSLVYVEGSLSIDNLDCGPGVLTGIELVHGTVYGGALGITGTRTSDFNQAPYQPTDKGVIYHGPAPYFTTDADVGAIARRAAIIFG